MEKQPKKIECGLVMPISEIDGCTADHWSDVRSIITHTIESIKTPAFNIKMVSDADDIGVIQKRIIQNLFNSDIIICDVSGKNPNVMFELGIRLAFDKATVIIKDDKTNYSFDTSIIEHIEYPRDLNYIKISDFKNRLIEKISATYREASTNPEYSTFLKNFGQFQIAKISQSETEPYKVILDVLSDIQSELSSLRNGMPYKELYQFLKTGQLDCNEKCEFCFIPSTGNKNIVKYSKLHIADLDLKTKKNNELK